MRRAPVRQRRAGRFGAEDTQGGGGGGGASTAWRSEERRQRMLALMEEMDEDEEVDWDALAIKVRYFLSLRLFGFGGALLCVAVVWGKRGTGMPWPSVCAV